MSLSVKSLLLASQDFGRCRIDDVRLETVSRRGGEERHVQVHLVPKKGTMGTMGTCSCCGQLAAGYDTLPQRRWQYLPILCCVVWLTYAPRRVNCPRCGVKVERLTWCDGKSPYSLPLMHFLARWARRISWLECAKVFGVSWDAVYRSVQWLVSFGFKHRKLEAVEAIGVDELHWRKGKKSENFLTLVYQVCAGQRRLLWVGKTRKEATLKRGLSALEAECPGFCSRVKVACSDMWKPFLKVIRMKLPKALNVLDRFHIVGHLNRAVDEVRRGEQAKLGKAAKQRVKGGRFTLLRKGSRVRGKAREKLNDMLYALHDTATAWMLKETFGRFWKYRSVTWANAWLGNWIDVTKRKNLKPMVRVAKMLERHRDLLMNYFRARREFSSAVVEGLNNKARVSLAKSYGHRFYDVLEVALYHALANLPEPPLTHKFC